MLCAANKVKGESNIMCPASTPSKNNLDNIFIRYFRHSFCCQTVLSVYVNKSTVYTTVFIEVKK
jgi:hypothetical protein